MKWGESHYNKANQPDTDLLFRFSVVVLEDAIYQQKDTVPVICGAVNGRCVLLLCLGRP